jgi:hypothetical protein
MLPMLARQVAGVMAKQDNGQASAQAAPGGGLGGLLGSLLGGGGGAQSQGLAGMLDMNGDGNPLDDIMGLANKFLR